MTGWPYRHPPNTQFVLNTHSPQARGLVAWWPTLASRGASTLRDLSGYGRHAVTAGAGWTWDTVPGIGPAPNFNNDDGRAAAAYDYDISPAHDDRFTLSTWFRVDSVVADTFNAIITPNELIGRLEIDGWSNEIQLRYWDSGWASRSLGGITPTVGALYHAVFSAGASSADFYLNGVLVGTNNPVVSFYDLTGLYFGTNAGGTDRGDITIGDTRLYNYALITAEVRALHDPATRWELYQPVVRRWTGYVSAGANLTATDLTGAAPTLDSPLIGQKHALAATDLTAGTPTLDSPVTAEVDTLTASDVTSGTPTLDPPTLAHIHDLAATDLTAAAPTLDPPTIGQEHGLTANDITSATPTLGAPTLAEGGGTDNLTASDLTAGTPTLDTPTIAQIHALTANDLLSGTLLFDSPIFDAYTNTPGARTSTPILATLSTTPPTAQRTSVPY